MKSETIGKIVNYKDPNAKKILAEYISSFLRENTLVVCIGTDKCIGDSLGPLVGTFLKESSFPLPVIGNLQSPAHAINLEKIINNIKNQYPNHFIIAIDACLGFEENIGDIQVKLGPVHPGKGVGKTLPSIGDISIVGVVDSIDINEGYWLNNIRLSFVWDMARIISESLILAAKQKGM
ncbi:putative sporulation protein YyaC [Caloramator fervidus]|uniref:Putative sporulation protein YyaC n=1 Tax=Caloramator fervidus TaxID=29344 RepID=A0A1H5RLK6_9CLOT|nr:spore protease YyaC [Caloramator fervidus]SEF39229.1 putative sporulation protein YyaC [Caloramator fervidus]